MLGHAPLEGGWCADGDIGDFVVGLVFSAVLEFGVVPEDVAFGEFVGFFGDGVFEFAVEDEVHLFAVVLEDSGFGVWVELGDDGFHVGGFDHEAVELVWPLHFVLFVSFLDKCDVFRHNSP